MARDTRSIVKLSRREGYALQDWLDAEYIVNHEIYETH